MSTTTNPVRSGTMSNFTLLAVPFFIFMGTMLEKSKLAEDQEEHLEEEPVSGELQI